MKKNKIKYCLENNIRMEFFDPETNRVKKINNTGDQIFVSYDNEQMFLANVSGQQIIKFDEIYEVGGVRNAKRFDIR